jgi:hypothetical protein
MTMLVAIAIATGDRPGKQVLPKFKDVIKVFQASAGMPQ